MDPRTPMRPAALADARPVTNESTAISNRVTDAAALASAPPYGFDAIHRGLLTAAPALFPDQVDAFLYDRNTRRTNAVQHPLRVDRQQLIT